jgi:predicted transcriptional regulator
MSKIKSITAMIEIEKLRKEYLIHRKWRLMEALEPDGIKVSSLGDDLDASCIHGNSSKAFEDIWPKIAPIQVEINDCNQEIMILQRLKNQMFEKINGVCSVDEKVKYLRDYIGLSLCEIADLMGYSYDHIRRLSAKINKG